MSSYLSIGLCFATCLISAAASAKYCVKLPSCEELGYIFPYKEGRRSIRCPFDTSKVLYLDYCQAYGLTAKPDSTAGAFQECVEEKADGTKINTGYYRYTRCNSGYTYLSGNCVYSCASNQDYPLNAPAQYCKTSTDSKVFNGITCYSATCQECENGYDMDSSGNCWNCQANSDGVAYGLLLCGEGKIGNSQKNSKTCADKTYYEECLVVETCFNEYREVPTSQCSTGIIQSYLNSKNEYTEKCYTSSGYELDKSKSCQRSSDAQTYYEIKSCTTTGATCAGKKQCPNNEGAAGETACTCGGYKYFSKCKETCEYNYRAVESGDKCSSGVEVLRSYLSGSNYSQSCWSGYVLDKSSASCQRADGKTYYANRISCTASGQKCNGYNSCNYGGTDGATTCTCGGTTYYSKCKDVCDGYIDDSSCASGVRRYYSNGDYCAGMGYEINKSSSTCTINGKTVYVYSRNCTTTGATCAGKKRCAFPDPGSLCSCGGYLYADNCLTACNYQETAETCASKGKSFSVKCLTEEQQYGECI